MKPIFFDIETIPLPEAELRAMMPEFDPAEVKVGNLKDEAKIIAKIAEAKLSQEQEFIENAALSAVTGRVAMIGLLVEDDMVILDSGISAEATTIKRFLDYCNESIGTSTQIIGFNTHEFDLPFVVRRAWKLGVRVPSGICYGRRYDYWNDIFVDMRKVWLMGERSPAKGTSSLDGLAKFFGLPPKKGNGKDFYKMDRKQQLEYLEDDVRKVQELWRRMIG